MVGLLFAAGCLLLSGLGVGTLAGLGVHETNLRNTAAKEKALRYAKLLAERRAALITFYLEEGRTQTGRVIIVDPELLVVQIDIRRLKRHKDTGEIMEPEGAPLPTDIDEVDLESIQAMDIHTEDPVDEEPSTEQYEPEDDPWG